jgi:hypothetical protein
MCKRITRAHLRPILRPNYVGLRWLKPNLARLYFFFLFVVLVIHINSVFFILSGSEEDEHASDALNEFSFGIKLIEDN